MIVKRIFKTIRKAYSPDYHSSIYDPSLIEVHTQMKFDYDFVKNKLEEIRESQND